MLKRRQFVQISGFTMCAAAVPAVGNATHLLQRGTLNVHLTAAERQFIRSTKSEIIMGMEQGHKPKRVATAMLYPVDVPMRDGQQLTYHNAAGQLVKITKGKGGYRLSFNA